MAKHFFWLQEQKSCSSNHFFGKRTTIPGRGWTRGAWRTENSGRWTRFLVIRSKILGSETSSVGQLGRILLHGPKILVGGRGFLLT